VKIESQFVGTAQATGIKTSSSPDNGTEFQNAFAAATNVSNHGSAPQIMRSKPQIRDTKPQAPESKKKEAASEPAAPNAAALPAVNPKQLAWLDASRTQIGLLGDGSGPSEPFAQRLQTANTSKTADEVVSGPVTGLREATTGGLDAASGPARGRSVPTDGVSPAGLASTKSSTEGIAMEHAAQSQAGAVQSAQSAVPASVSQPVTEKAARAGDGSDPSKTGDVSSVAADASSVDPSVLAVQQAASPMMQSVAAPSVPASLSSGLEFQTASAIGAAKTYNTTPGADSTKVAASRQTDSSVKGKAAQSDLRSKRTDDASDDTQTSLATAATPGAFAAKVSEGAGGVNHSASDSKGSLDAAGLQQITQAGQPAASDHGPVSGQSAGVAAEPAMQAAQAAPDNQAAQGVNSAQLIQSVHSSEMKLGMQSAEFGNISISTSLNHQALSAQISIDHSDLGKALAVHLPAIEEKLGSAYGVQAKVELRDTNNPSQSGESGYSNSGQQAKEHRQSQSQAGTSAGGVGTMFGRTAAPARISTTLMSADTSRLDITI